MNLANVCQLVKQAGQSRAIITIDVSGDNAVLLLQVPMANGNIPNLDNANELALRQALATPLMVTGEFNEIDLQIDESVAEFAGGFIDGAKDFDKVTSNASATKAATTAAKAKAPTKKSPQTTAKKTAPKATSPSTANVISASTDATDLEKIAKTIPASAADDLGFFNSDAAL